MRVTDCSEDGIKRPHISTRKGAHTPREIFSIQFDKAKADQSEAWLRCGASLQYAEDGEEKQKP